MKTIVQELREEKNLTQTELAEKSGLSLRTIQRIEAGNIPKGFTLRTLAQTFEIEPEKLISTKQILKLDRAKLINLSSLMGLILPFGGVIFPLILTNKTDDKINKELGKNIVSVQILLTVSLSFSLIVSPFIQKELLLNFPLFLIPLLSIIAIKLLIVIINGISLNKNNDLHKNLKINYL
ncbi:transcriptional regulator with XRE-family HTH domain [Flavobacterium sp. 7E]|uniref:helix-turn-helix domain-containing protein n=1 Tax=Flavobacterium sp. 7E TaxID=2735898 RepID=UPI00156D893C|nr:helix-turn-helix domain-containing protein [Flavobacterium sp. 7E]NRS90878.1 transcriptional regulator with XRE-family HTH domain [Flavobacterium sp. 7E]